MKTDCKFCQKFGEAYGEYHVADRVLFQSENFVVVPSIGSIVPGWLLVIPRKHFLSVGSLDREYFEEFLEIRKVAAGALQDCFGPICFFEHGPVRERESIGCGVDHAHLHIVAISQDVVGAAKELSNGNMQWHPVSGIQASKEYVAKQKAYVFIQSLSHGGWIGTADAIESQMIRKTIALLTGQPSCWDWKANMFEENIKETVTRLEEWKSIRLAVAA